MAACHKTSPCTLRSHRELTGLAFPVLNFFSGKDWEFGWVTGALPIQLIQVFSGLLPLLKLCACGSVYASVLWLSCTRASKPCLYAHRSLLDPPGAFLWMLVIPSVFCHWKGWKMYICVCVFVLKIWYGFRQIHGEFVIEFSQTVTPLHAIVF